LGQVVPRLLEVMQQPRKLAEGIGGALLLTAAYIFCLDACIRALGGSVSLASTAVVYLTGAALGSAVPTPGGLGAVEAALSAAPRRAGRGGGGAVGRAHRRRPPGRDLGQRGAALPHHHVLAPDPYWLGRLQLPGAARLHLSARPPAAIRPSQPGGHPPSGSAG